MLGKESIGSIEGYGFSDSLAAARPRALSPLRTLRALVRAWSDSGAHFSAQLGTARSQPSSQPAPAELFTAAVIGDLLLGLPDTEELMLRLTTLLLDGLRQAPLLALFKDRRPQPADVGCTALALSLLLRFEHPVAKQAHHALDLMLQHVTSEGIVPAHIGDSVRNPNHIDLVTCINVLYLARMLGRADEVQPTELYVRWFFLNEHYQQGTRYHLTAETFLYFLGRLICHFPNTYVSLRQNLGQAVLARVGTSRQPIDLAQRIILARWLGLPDYTERAQLQRLQQSDGTWPADSILLIQPESKYGTGAAAGVHADPLLLGSTALSTAFAYRALTPESS